MSHVIEFKQEHVYIVNKMAFDDMAVQGARASAAIVLSFFSRNISVSTPKKF